LKDENDEGRVQDRIYQHRSLVLEFLSYVHLECFVVITAVGVYDALHHVNQLLKDITKNEKKEILEKSKEGMDSGRQVSSSWNQESSSEVITSSQKSFFLMIERRISFDSLLGRHHPLQYFS
jgi:hypothetical protein